jgi:hypothetical protein
MRVEADQQLAGEVALRFLNAPLAENMVIGIFLKRKEVRGYLNYAH